MFSHAQYLLIKNKKIFECFSCFWKVFCFCKNVKNFKNSVALFWRLSHELVQSHVPIASPHRDFSQLTGRLMPQSRKTLRIFFKIWFLMFLATQSSDLFAGGRSSREWYTEIFAAPDRDSLVSGTSSREKHLENFPKVLSFKCSSGWP